MANLAGDAFAPLPVASSEAEDEELEDIDTSPRVPEARRRLKDSGEMINCSPVSPIRDDDDNPQLQTGPPCDAENEARLLGVPTPQPRQRRRGGATSGR